MELTVEVFQLPLPSIAGSLRLSVLLNITGNKSGIAPA